MWRQAFGRIWSVEHWISVSFCLTCLRQQDAFGSGVEKYTAGTMLLFALHQSTLKEFWTATITGHDLSYGGCWNLMKWHSWMWFVFSQVHNSSLWVSSRNQGFPGDVRAASESLRHQQQMKRATWLICSSVHWHVRHLDGNFERGHAYANLLGLAGMQMAAALEMK